MNHNCVECFKDYSFYINSFNISNCYEKCDNYYYFDESSDFHCVEICPVEYNKLIIERNKCIDDYKNDDIYKYEYNNICQKDLPDSTIVNDITEKIDGKINEKLNILKELILNKTDKPYSSNLDSRRNFKKYSKTFRKWI